MQQSATVTLTSRNLFTPCRIALAGSVLAGLVLGGCVLRGDLESRNRYPIIESIETMARGPGLRCSVQEVCVTARDRDFDPIEIVWEQTTARAVAEPRVTTTTANEDGSVTECIEFIPQEAGSYEFRITAYDLIVTDDGRLVRREDLSLDNGDPAASHAETMFAFSSSPSGPAPQAEICDGLDNDCDFTIDDVEDIQCSTVAISGSVFVLDYDIFSQDEFLTTQLAGSCVVGPDHRFSSIQIGGEATCVDSVMADIVVECTLQEDDKSVKVEVIGTLFEEDTCPNNDLNGQDAVTEVLDPGSSAVVEFTVENTAEGGDYIDISLDLEYVASVANAQTLATASH